MAENIRINKEDGIVEVVSLGIVTKENIESLITKIKQIGNEFGINKVLLDTTKQELMPDITSIYEIFSKMPCNLRIAILANQEQNTLHDVKFAETVARNRSIQVKIFFLREAALEWLEKSINALSLKRLEKDAVKIHGTS